MFQVDAYLCHAQVSDQSQAIMETGINLLLSAVAIIQITIIIAYIPYCFISLTKEFSTYMASIGEKCSYRKCHIDG